MSSGRTGRQQGPTPHLQPGTGPTAGRLLAEPLWYRRGTCGSVFFGVVCEPKEMSPETRSGQSSFQSGEEQKDRPGGVYGQSESLSCLRLLLGTTV